MVCGLPVGVSMCGFNGTDPVAFIVSLYTSLQVLMQLSSIFKDASCFFHKIIPFFSSLLQVLV